MRTVQATQPRSLRPAPWPEEKKKEDRTRARLIKVAGAELEDFVDWVGVIANEPTEEEEMSRLAVGFATRMRKRARRVSPPLYLMESIQSGLHQMKRLRRTGQSF